MRRKEADIQPITLTVKEFMALQACPRAWRKLDLYLVRDGDLVFYVGQSEAVLERLWKHILDGYKGRSAIGRFILCNWRASLDFTIELLSSQSSRFAGLDGSLDAAEHALIEEYAPCFNRALNHQPTPLPERYTPTTAPLPPNCSRNPKRLAQEAERLLKGEQRKNSHPEIWENDEQN